MRRGAWAAAALLALLMGAMLSKSELLTLPEVPVHQAEGFDADRAVRRLARILGDERPHAVDTDASDPVRDRLAAEMRAVGLEPRIADEFACNEGRGRNVNCARVRNLVATIGPAEGEHLLLSAHYDSTFAGPGAADAGMAVATLLETAALLRGEDLRRPVTLLFNEGEEAGLIGARAFLERDPLAPRVGALVNLEARGVAGPAIMFETSRPNAPAIAHFARSSDRPLANSLTTDFYGMIPNSTDVAVFDERDWTILNFAVIGNESRYHSPGDDLAALDRNSLQHMGEQTLALTASFAAAPAPEAEGTRLYADLLGRQLVVLPLAFGLILLGLLLLSFAVAAWRRGAPVRSVAALAAAPVAAVLLAWAGAWLLGELRGGAWWRGHPWTGAAMVYGAAILACVLALRWIGGEAGRARLRAWYWFGFLSAGAAITALAPGAAIFFLFPPLLAAIGLAAARRWPAAERIGGIAAAVLLFLSFGPALGLMEELLSNGPIWIFAPLGTALLLPFLIEAKPLLRARTAPAAAIALFAAGWGAAALAPAYSAERPQRFTIEYVWDAAAGEGRWAVRNDSKELPAAFEAVGDWERAELPYSKRRRWVADAPDLPVPSPAVELIGEDPAGAGRRLRVRLAANGAQTVTLLAPPDADLRAAGAAGYLREFGEGEEDDRYVLHCTGRSCDGAELDIVAAGRAPFDLTVVGMHPGLPDEAAPLVAGRPARAHPQYGPDATYAVGRARF